MGEPATLEGKQLADVVERAVRTVAAIAADEANPAAAPFLDRIAAELAGERSVDETLSIMRETVSALVTELDLFAIALVTVTDGGQADARVERKNYLRNLRARIDLERQLERERSRAQQLEAELADQLELNKSLARGDAS